MEFRKENEGYWSQRAASYSDVNKGELAGENRVNWLRELLSHMPEKDPSEVKVLDIGTGPGFFAIILAEAGYQVTAVDYTQAMLDEAETNASNESDKLAESIIFKRMDAQNLEFEDNTFDVIVTRNLTWNLPEPAKAYGEWVRVLKEGGVLLNYDANWYKYLYDDQAKEAYEADRKASEQAGAEDQNVGDNFDKMEELAKQVPLSDIRRPQWDLDVLAELPVSVEVNENVWENVWSAEEKLNFSSTPMFNVEVKKTKTNGSGDENEDILEIAGLTASRGEKVQGTFVLGGEFKMPGCLIRGEQDGETILITAGIHAGEYNGIETLSQMSEQIRPEDVKGTIILVKAVCSEEFENRSGSLIGSGSLNGDGENLNRLFPGRENGTKGQRLAYLLAQELINKVDYYIDLHSGDTYENLTPFVYYAGKAAEEVTAKSRDMARIADVPYMVRSNVSMGGAYNYAASWGVPSIILERGGMGRCDIESVGSMKKDLLNILNYLDFYDTDWERQSYFPLDVKDMTYQYAAQFGLWHPLKKPGDLIYKGELIGYVTDYEENVVERAVAQYDGVILYQTKSLQVTENGPMIAYGKIVTEGDERKKRITNYWSKRSDSFLKQRRDELHDPISERWLEQIFRYFPKDKKLNILDVGCGAGYFSILLAKEGHTCTGVDLTTEMIDAAKVLAKEEGVDCTFAVMDAEKPEFPEESFDCIICRNLVWTLPHPEEAYECWTKLVKKGGLILVFDADYGKDNNSSKVKLPKNHAHNMIGKDMLVEYELIKQMLPISSYSRPAWDLDALSRHGVAELQVDLQAGRKIYLKKDEFYNPVPLFAICAKVEG